jgi:hypothetical protein
MLLLLPLATVTAKNFSTGLLYVAINRCVQKDHISPAQPLESRVVPVYLQCCSATLGEPQQKDLVALPIPSCYQAIYELAQQVT